MWEWLKNLLGVAAAAPVPDPRPDPEDPLAYKFIDDLIKAFEKEGRHFQALKGGSKPSDEEKVLAKADKDKAPAGYTWWVDVYDGPRGKGFQVGFEISRADGTYQKIVNLGPEPEREQDWTKVEQPAELAERTR